MKCLLADPVSLLSYFIRLTPYYSQQYYLETGLGFNVIFRHHLENKCSQISSLGINNLFDVIVFCFAALCICSLKRCAVRTMYSCHYQLKHSRTAQKLLPVFAFLLCLLTAKIRASYKDGITARSHKMSVVQHK